MSTLKNKIDFALVFAATNANPNGDPLDGNRPRTDFKGFGEVTDVCLKRKIRNRLQDMGERIFVQSDDRRDDGMRSLKARADAAPELKDLKPEQYGETACKLWFDVRAFGQVFAFKDKKGSDSEEGSDAVSIGIRGPVSIQTAFSVHPVNITSTQITKSVNLETEKNPDKKASDTMGTKHRVDFGLYTTFGSINVKQAEKTGFSEEDAECIKEALKTLFRNDETSARPSGSMQVVKLIWWKHNCEIGQYPPIKVHRSLKVTAIDPNKTPSCVEDFTIAIEPLEGLQFEEIDGE
ncbi:MAG: type I-C CRISPR-associated protein Cas7/Csd2 [Clostridiales bacterium]|nr:type I-C CRISPR-associated protein Cas7/Csd2 [Clostridiales bacterium]